jgi:hypothetical protein
VILQGEGHFDGPFSLVLRDDDPVAFGIAKMP